MGKFRLWTLILAFFTFAALFACSNNPAPSDGYVSTSETMPEESTGYTLNLPETDMEGKVFTFLTTNWPGEAIWTFDEITIEEQDGSAVNDAMYLRNVNVQTRFNCKIGERNIDSYVDAVNELNKSIHAGDNAYDIFIPRMQALTTLVVNDMIIDLKKLGYIDFSKPWWDARAVDDLSLASKNFGANSYMTTMDKGAISTFVFNKELMRDYNIEMPYGYILDGSWTLDKMAEQIKAVSSDLNADGKMDSNDLYGLLYQRDTLHDMLIASGESVAKKDEKGLPYVSLNSESAISKIQHMFEILYDTNTCFNVMTLPGDFNVGMNSMFQSNQGLYMWIRMVNIVPLRTMEADFGIAVVPKFEELQKEYYSTVNPYTGIFICVPVTNIETDHTGMFLEAMAYEGYMHVRPAYYDVLLNGIIARDNESSQMLDILFANRRYDLGVILDMGDLRSFIYMVMNYDTNIVSYVEKRLRLANKDIEKLTDALLKNDG
ncbi:MAG TPA: hypothetical protein PK778_03670 [Bacillota bacterium]|nr:hypothetical protein [Clostridiales bacterium]HPT85071.1 hypothetical protein [Bacillota bacterium]